MGSRVGTKRKDKRWVDDDGIVWASEFECRVYTGLRDVLGAHHVFKCEPAEGDSFGYTTQVPSGSCVECGSTEIVQQRTYTPDVRVVGEHPDARPVYVESKGYFPREARELLRNFRRTGPDIGLIVIFQRNAKATAKRTYGQYADSFLKVPWFVWNPMLVSQREPPEDLVEYLTHCII